MAKSVRYKSVGMLILL